MTIPETLIHQLVQGRVVPFVGSGVSLAVQPGLFPTWSKLLGTLAQRLQQESNDDAAEIVRRYVKKGQLNKAANEALDELGPAHFREVMQATFGIGQPAEVDLALPTTLWSLRPKLVVTTNYDRVFQWSNSAARIATNSQQANLADLFAGSDADQPFVWHLHGHIDDPDSLILAPQQYDRLYREAGDDKHPYAAARLQLRNLIGNHPLLFVGFGLQDEYVMDALAAVLEIFGGNLRPSYALLKTGDDRARTLWDKHQIQTIEYADYGGPLVELVAEMARQMNAAPADLQNVAVGPCVIPPAYIQWLTDQCADITPLGMEPDEGQSVCLQQVYVPPLTSRRFADEALGEVMQADRGAGKGKRRKGKKSAAREEAAEEALEEAKPQLLLDLLGQRSLYVSGDPGSGKSTFCRWVAWLAATGETLAFEVADVDDFQEKLPDSLRGRLPVLLRLREFREYLPAQPGRRALTVDQLQTALKDWLDNTRPGGLCWSDVAPHLAAGSLLLILDGVDEMPLTEGEDAAVWSPRESFLAGVTAAAVEWLKTDNRLLVTSRPYGLQADQVRQLERAGLAEARLDPLPESLQNLLASRWFVALPKTSADGRQIATAMLDQVRRLSEDVAALAANPLLLTAICIIYGEGKQLPKDIHDLYHRIIKTALHSRYPRDRKVIDWVRARLAAVALGMHTGEPHERSRTAPVPEITYAELDEILRVYIRANPESESGFRDQVQAREDLLSHSGLLSQATSEKASFFHLSFQEFLAAEQLARLNDGEDKLLAVFRGRAELANWRHTLRFLFARRVAHPGWQAGKALLQRMLAAIDVQQLARSLGLALSSVDALAILLDQKLDLQSELRASFRAVCLAAIEQDVELKSRAELARMLGRVGDPRVVDDLSDRDAWVEVPAGTYRVGDTAIKKEYNERNALTPETVTFARPFQLSKYLVTNGQFRWEWCSDTFEPAKVDEPDAGRVLRGGSWFDPPDGCRSAIRVDDQPGLRDDVAGFRAART